MDDDSDTTIGTPLRSTQPSSRPIDGVLTTADDQANILWAHQDLSGCILIATNVMRSLYRIITGTEATNMAQIESFSQQYGEGFSHGLQALKASKWLVNGSRARCIREGVCALVGFIHNLSAEQKRPFEESPFGAKKALWAAAVYTYIGLPPPRLPWRPRKELVPNLQ